MALDGLSDIYAGLILTLEYVGNKIHYAADSLQSAGAQLYDEGHQYAGTSLINAHNSLEFAAYRIGYSTMEADRLSVRIPAAFALIDTNWPSDGEVDMDAILNAMLVADFDQLQKFIGIVDAYRVAIWNAPFNANFYAALARGFE
ncbi:unnamed protein product, partial [marine sediment metagenome]